MTSPRVSAPVNIGRSSVTPADEKPQNEGYGEVRILLTSSKFAGSMDTATGGKRYRTSILDRRGSLYRGYRVARTAVFTIGRLCGLEDNEREHCLKFYDIRNSRAMSTNYEEHWFCGFSVSAMAENKGNRTPLGSMSGRKACCHVLFQWSDDMDAGVVGRWRRSHSEQAGSPRRRATCEHLRISVSLALGSRTTKEG